MIDIGPKVLSATSGPMPVKVLCDSFLEHVIASIPYDGFSSYLEWW